MPWWTRALHAFTAALLAYLDPVALVAASLAYVAYQAFSDRKAKDMIDWIAGIAVGTVLRVLTRLM